MTLLESLLLGIVQGATEFLPISSSGHLILGQYILELEELDPLFDVLLHLGTLLAVVGFYREEVREMIAGLYRGGRDVLEYREFGRILEPRGAQLAVLVALASLPTALIGALVEVFLQLERGEAEAARFVCIALLINGAILYASRYTGGLETPVRSEEWGLWNITPSIALMIGTAQGLAVLPGLSRSGLTIVVALFLGVWRDEAARFSFLMSIPAIVGALLLRFECESIGEISASTWGTFGIGVLTAGLVGYIAILYLVRLVQRAQFYHFSWYCWALSGGGLLYLWLGM